MQYLKYMLYTISQVQIEAGREFQTKFWEHQVYHYNILMILIWGM